LFYEGARMKIIETAARVGRSWADELAVGLVRVPGMSANAVTYAGLALSGVAGVCIALSAWPLAILAIGLAGASDLLDGAVARRIGGSRLGAVVDALSDRVGEVMILSGFFAVAVGRAGDGLVTACMVMSLLVPLTASYLDGAGIEVRNAGPMPRGVRLVVLALACIPAIRLLALFVLVLGSGVTVVARLSAAWNLDSGSGDRGIWVIRAHDQRERWQAKREEWRDRGELRREERKKRGAARESVRSRGSRLWASEGGGSGKRGSAGRGAKRRPPRREKRYRGPEGDL